MHTYSMHPCIDFRIPFYLSHASHHDELEGLANASTNHPYTSYSMFNNLNSFLFNPNTTPKNYFFVALQCWKKGCNPNTNYKKKYHWILVWHNNLSISNHAIAWHMDICFGIHFYNRFIYLVLLWLLAHNQHYIDILLCHMDAFKI